MGRSADGSPRLRGEQTERRCIAHADAGGCGADKNIWRRTTHPPTSAPVCAIIEQDYLSPPRPLVLSLRYHDRDRRAVLRLPEKEVTSHINLPPPMRSIYNDVEPTSGCRAANKPNLSQAIKPSRTDRASRRLA
ncbi:hypothetical protein THAOC_18955 [Thalassiosira oceanica]|uniref:Uncharacterized protein n=1 Tax=Thalassiosira oceanica TaxID=159749 RepID=K0S3M7_THAOC|nr:hypothetical protein THAOC_18955 [Thalassiosira oceanica]|eukprot:EJK60653.1 hypothetical protein THAOC_18955 [Thalassiosira oceanica]